MLTINARLVHYHCQAAAEYRKLLRGLARIKAVSLDIGCSTGVVFTGDLLAMTCGPQKVRSISPGDLLQPIFVVQSAEHLLNSYPTIRQ